MLHKKSTKTQFSTTKSIERMNKSKNFIKLPQISIGNTLCENKHDTTLSTRQINIKTIANPVRPLIRNQTLKPIHCYTERNPPCVRSLNPLNSLETRQQKYKNLLKSNSLSLQTPLKYRVSINLPEKTPNVEQSFSSSVSEEEQLEKKEIDSSFITDDTYSIWDNMELRMRGVEFDELDEMQKIQQFLTLYKMRCGVYPGQRENLTNEKVIKVAAHYAMQNKALFKKYFPLKQVKFENNEDYSSRYDIQSDNNFKKFEQYVQKNKRKTEVNL